MGTVPPGGQVTIGGKMHGEAPMNLTLKSGPYTVEILWPELNKRATCVAKVLGDKTARVKGNVQSDRCTVETN